MRFVAIGLVLISLFTSLHAADLVTREGKVYHDYKVVGHDDGYLTILFSDGGATLRLKDLPDAVQQQCGYDPVKAEAFVRQHDALDAQQRMAVQQAQMNPNNDAMPLARSDDPANTPAPSMDAASKTDAAPDTSLDAGVDPLAPDTQILHTHEDPEYQDEGDSVDTYPGVVISDEGDANGYWFIYTDTRGIRHRDFHLRERVHFGPGQWIVFVDPHGVRHREFHQMHETHDRAASALPHRDLQHSELPSHLASNGGNHNGTSSLGTSASGNHSENHSSSTGGWNVQHSSPAPSSHPSSAPSYSPTTSGFRR